LGNSNHCADGPSWAINGRFLTPRVMGVQGYAAGCPVFPRTPQVFVEIGGDARGYVDLDDGVGGRRRSSASQLTRIFPRR
jgi:hypothetical protein